MVVRADVRGAHNWARAARLSSSSKGFNRAKCRGAAGPADLSRAVSEAERSEVRPKPHGGVGARAGARPP
jgi:hypothetical protein